MFDALPFLAVLLAPVAVAMAAYFGHVVVRGTKISEFRQAWIDAQRQDLAIVVARAYLLLETQPHVPTHEEPRLKAFEELEEAAYRIKLRENPRKPEWTDVIGRVDRIRQLVRDPASTHDQLPCLAGGMLPPARIRLKIEWDLVKEGERSYQRTTRVYWRYVVGVAALAVAILLLGELLRPAVHPADHRESGNRGSMAAGAR